MAQKHKNKISRTLKRIKKGFRPSDSFMYAMKGKHHSLKTRKQISKSHKKIKHTVEWNRNQGFARIKNTKITKKKYLSIKDGLIYQRRNALIRDDYTCQICGLRDIEIMEIDHIKSKSKFPKLRYDLNNLITLCPNCHTRKTIRELKQKTI